MQEKVFTEIKIEVGKIYLALLKKDLKVTSTLDEFQRKWMYQGAGVQKIYTCFPSNYFLLNMGGLDLNIQNKV